jgi:phosphatidate phosphatase APP1
MDLASQEPEQEPPQVTKISGSQAFRLAHLVSDTVNRLRLKTARRWKFTPQTIAYQGYGSTEWVRVLGRVVLTSRPVPGSRAEQAAQNGNQNVRGWRAFTSVPIQFVEVDIEIGGVTTRVHADRGGIVDTVVPVSLTPGWHSAVLRAEGTEPAQAMIYVIAPETTLGIVSDIDDTIMVTALPRPFLALWNTFVLNERARMATPGMAVLLDRLLVEHPEAPVIYLSTGPWNAAPTLARFITRNMYPSGTLLLTDWGLTNDRWFRSGQDHKRRNLELLAKEFPNMRWLLFGDNGQHDEAIYSQFAREHGDRVAAIGIRQLSAGESVLAGGHSENGDHTGSTVPWVYSPDGAGMAKRLRELEIL